MNWVTAKSKHAMDAQMPERRSTSLFSSQSGVAGSRLIRRGFTLVEVLATLLLIAIVLPAVMRGIVLASAAADAAKHRTVAQSLAQSKLADIISSGDWQSSSTLSGDFSPDAPDYKWGATIADWAQDTQGVGLEEIDITVSWNERGASKSLTISSLAYPRAASSTTN
jgi:prepilin-type N-terminal cleavage/methylation domain-containing protein